MQTYLRASFTHTHTHTDVSVLYIVSVQTVKAALLKLGSYVMILKFCFEQLQIPKERKSSTLIFAAADSPARRHGFLGPTAATQHESKAVSVALCLFDTVPFIRPLPTSGQRYPTLLGNRPVSPTQAGGGRGTPVSACRLMVGDYLTRVHERYC